MRIKICGITQVDQGQAIAQLGASTLGFICAPTSPRFVTPPQIRAIVDALPPHPLTGQGVDRIGVFVNASLEEIVETATIGGLTGIQLHGSESPDFCQQLRYALPDRELIKAFRIRSAENLAETVAYERVVDTLLLDAYHPQLQGGTGITLDWSALQQFRPDRPWLLAGGLTPDNVQQALQQLHPDGIDLSSGVERAPGDKDLQLVNRLFEALQQV